MKFKTKLWKRSPTSYATTIPRVALLSIDENKDYEVTWEYDKQKDAWLARITEPEKNSRRKVKNG